MINVVFLKQDSPKKSADRLLPKMVESGADAFLFGTNMISLACLYTIKDMGQEVISKIGLVGFDGNPVFDFFLFTYILHSATNRCFGAKGTWYISG